MSEEERIPKFHFYLTNLEGSKVLWLNKSEWQDISSNHLNKPILIDISRTPMQNVNKGSTFVASRLVNNTSDNSRKIEIFRYDEKDSKPYNKDIYYVFENITEREDYLEIVNSATTCDNHNLRDFLNNNICFIKKKPLKDDHWFSEDELPDSIKTLINELRDK